MKAFKIVRTNIVFLFVFLLLVSLLPSCSQNSKTVNGIKNNFALSVGTKIYVTVISNDTSHLIQMDDKWNKLKTICNDSAQLIASDENYIYYYVDSSEIYRIQSNGEKRQKLALSYSKGQLYNNRIYYKGDDGLYSMSTDGSNVQKVSLNDNFGKFTIYKDWIYYQNHDDNGSLYKIKLDGSSKQIVSDANSSTSFCIYNDSIIYIDFDNNSTIWKMNLDGDEKLQIATDSSMLFNIFNDKIYYNNSNLNGDLYSIAIDGTNKTKIANGPAYDIDIINNTIIYRCQDTFYKIDASGTNQVELSSILG